MIFRTIRKRCSAETKVPQPNPLRAKCQPWSRKKGSRVFLEVWISLRNLVRRDLQIEQVLAAEVTKPLGLLREAARIPLISWISLVPCPVQYPILRILIDHRWLLFISNTKSSKTLAHHPSKIRTILIRLPHLIRVFSNSPKSSASKQQMQT